MMTEAEILQFFGVLVTEVAIFDHLRAAQESALALKMKYLEDQDFERAARWSALAKLLDRAIKDVQEPTGDNFSIVVAHPDELEWVKLQEPQLSTALETIKSLEIKDVSSTS
jgi:hypothetical protein